MSQGVIGKEGPGGHNREPKDTTSWAKCLIFRKKKTEPTIKIFEIQNQS